MSHLLPLSSGTASGLENLVERCSALLRNGADPAALCATAASAPASRHRAVFAGDSPAQLTGELAAFLGGAVAEDAAPVLVFSGIGGQWRGMAAGLLAGEPEFERAFGRWSLALEAAGLGWSPLELSDDDRIHEMRYAMPCLAAIQASLFEVLTAWGVRPAAVAGHSVGEITAAYAAGALSFDDTVALVVARHNAELAVAGRGGMAVVAAAEREVAALLRDGIEIAGVNDGAETVVAGPSAALDAFMDEVRARGLRTGRVRIDVPCHTSALDGPGEALEHALAGLAPQPSAIPLYSCTTGGLVDGTVLTGRHWRANLRDTVRFDKVIGDLLAAGHRMFLEVGPHPVLTASITREFDTRGADVGSGSGDLALGTLIRDTPSRTALLRAAGELWARGAALDLAVLSAPARASAELLAQLAQEEADDDGEGLARIARQVAAAPAWRRKEIVGGFVRREVARLTRAGTGDGDEAGRLDDEAPFSALGLDSARLTELARRLGAGLGLPVTVLDCFERPGIRQLSQSLLARLVGDTARDDGNAEAVAEPRSFAAAEPIAIVGAGCRLPGGVSSLEGFWELLDRGESGVAEVPAGRWPAEQFYADDDVPGRMRTKLGGFIHDVDRFDAAFFGITGDEAVRMDPAQRLLLQTVWEALENAGIDPAGLDASSTGVFVGSMNTGDYLARKESASQSDGWTSVYDATSVANSALAGRVSYFLGTVGPAMTVDTACSSSLVALHSAVTALRLGECELAIVAGVNLIMAPWTSVAFSQARMLSPDGQCRTFSADANGYVRGEGCAAVVLTSRSAARKAGLRPLANVLGSAVNQNGRTSGITAPSETAQRRVIQAALRAAGRTPLDIGYIEAHGTGTPLGDSIEMRALSSVMAAPGRPVWFTGSVKTNIGHLEAAAGMAGLLKAVLAVRNGRVPRHRNISTLNPAIDLDAAGVHIPGATLPWPDGYPTRAAGVSSFGFTGSNAHVVIEAESEFASAADEPAPGEGPHGPQGLLLPLSARTPRALATLAEAYRSRVVAEPESAAELCRVAALGRAHLPVRAAVTADDAAGLAAGLAALDTATRKTVRRPRIAFLFPGQGSQYPQMGARLRESEPVFRETLDEALRIAAENGVDLRDALASGDEAALRDSRHTQPAVFAVQIALLEQLRAWGVTPDMVIGHSLGEFSAAYAAGAVDLTTAMRVVCRRALLMAAQPQGAMLAVRMSREQFAEFADVAPVELATDNGDRSIVLSGTHEAIDAVQQVLSDAGVRCRRLAVSHAFHSALMDGALPATRVVLDGVAFGEPAIPMVSTVHGGLVEGPLTTGHWLANLRDPVRFRDGMRTIAGLEPDVLLEVGPTPVLLSAATEAAPDARPVAALRGRGEEVGDLRRMLAELYESGAALDWRAYHRGRVLRNPQDAPTYPFARDSYWLPFHTSETFRHAFLAAPVSSGDETAATATLSPGIPILDAHRVHGVPVLPAASCLEAVTAVGRRVLGARAAVAGCTIHSPIAVRPGQPTEVTVTVNAATSRFTVTGPGTAALFADGILARTDTSASPVPLAGPDSDGRELPGAQLRARWDRLGLAVGPWLATVGRTVVGAGSFRAALAVPEAARAEGAWWGQILLDGAFQAALSVIEGEHERALWLPSAFTGVTLAASVPAECTVHGEVVETAERMVAVRLVMTDADGSVVGSVERAEFRRAEAEVLAQALLGPGSGVSRVVLEPFHLDTTVRPARRWAVVGADTALRKELAVLLPPAQTTDADAVVLVLAADPDGEPDTVARDGLRRLHAAAREVLAARGSVLLHVVVDQGPEYFTAAIRAFCRSLALEEGQRWGGGVEIAAGTEPAAAAAAVAEVLERSPGEWLAWSHDGLARHAFAPWQGPPPEAVAIRDTGTYLVTGGLGGLGLAVAGWLVDQGAGAVALMGRSEPAPEAAQAIARMRDAGALVEVLRADVTDPVDVRRAICAIPDLRGVAHCAGVLDDGLLSEQDWGAQERVLAPKIAGAVHLHRETAAYDLDFFAVFSSVASCLGAHGQTAYGAANGFLDGLMAWRRANGLPGVALCWPAWTGTGMAHRDSAAGVRYWEGRGGVTSIGPVLGTHLFGRLAAAPVPQVVIGVTPGAGQPADLDRPAAAIGAGMTADQARAAVGTALRAALAAVGVTGELGEGSLRDHGLDSFQLIDLRRRLAEHGLTVSTDRLLGDGSAASLAEDIAADLVTVETPAGSAPSRQGGRHRLAELASLGSAFISGNWMRDSFRVSRLDHDGDTIGAHVAAESFVMPADGEYHLPVFQAFLWAELLTDQHARRADAPGAHLRTFALTLPERVSTPESIRPALQLTGGTSADFTVTGGGRWTGTVTFEPSHGRTAAYPGRPEEAAQACFDHYWNRYVAHDLEVEDVVVSVERIEAPARWTHAGEPIAPFTLMRWASQLCLIHAHWRFGFDRKPANEAYVRAVELEMHSDGVPGGDAVPLGFAIDDEAVHDGVAYLTGTFRAADLATIRLKLTVPLTDHDRRVSPNVH